MMRRMLALLPLLLPATLSGQSLLNVPDPDRLARGNAFHEVRALDRIGARAQRDRAAQIVAAADSLDSLDLRARLAQRQRLLSDLEGLYRRATRDNRRIAEMLIAEGRIPALQGSLLDSIRYFCREEASVVDSLSRLPTGYRSDPPATGWRPLPPGRTASLFIRMQLGEARGLTPLADPAGQYSRAEISAGMELLDRTSAQLRAAIEVLSASEESRNRWRDEAFKLATQAVTAGDYHRAATLLGMLRTASSPPGLHALIDWCALRSGELMLSSVSSVLPPVTFSDLAQLSDTLLYPRDQIYLDLAGWACEEGAYETALTYLQVIDLISGYGPEAALLRAKILRDRGDTAEAIALLRQVADQSARSYPKESFATHALVIEACGDALLAEGNPQAAVETWLGIEESAPNRSRSMLKAAWVALERGNLRAAQEWTRRLAKPLRGTVQGIEASVISAIAGGDDAQQLELLHQLTSLDRLAAATRHKMAAEALLAQSESLASRWSGYAVSEDRFDLERIATKVGIAAKRVIQESIPEQLRDDPVDMEPRLHPFEWQQLSQAGIREAELVRLAEMLEEWSFVCQEGLAGAGHPPFERERRQLARILQGRNRQTELLSPSAKVQEEVTVEVLTRCRAALRNSLALSWSRVGFDPSGIPARERPELMREVAEAHNSLDRLPEGVRRELTALLRLYIAQLLREEALERHPLSLESVRSAFGEVASDSAAPTDLRAHSLLHLAALDLEPGERAYLRRVPEWVDSLASLDPSSSLLPQSQLLSAQAWMVQRRPQFERAIPVIREARHRPGATLLRESLYLEAWCLLRANDAKPDRAKLLLDHAAKLPLPAPGAMDHHRSFTLRQEVLRELTALFLPPYVATPDSGFQLAEQFFLSDWHRIEAYGFEFYKTFGDILLEELGETALAAKAWEICRTGFDTMGGALLVELAAVRLVDLEQGEAPASFNARIEALRQWAPKESDRLARSGLEELIDSLATQRLIEAVSLAASLAISGGGPDWIEAMNEAADRLEQFGRPLPRLSHVLLLRAATLEKAGSTETHRQQALQQYRRIAERFPRSDTALSALERAYAILTRRLEASEDSSAASSPDQLRGLVPLTMMLADHFPEDTRTPHLLLNTALHVEGDAAIALLDTLLHRYPSPETLLPAHRAWFRIRIEQKRYDRVAERALEILAVQAGGTLHEQAATAYAEAAWHLAASQAEAGRVDEALRQYRRGAEIGRGSEFAPTLLYQAGLLAADHGRHEEARAFFEELALWYPASPHIASATFNLALTLDRLANGPGDAEAASTGPEEIAAAFEEAYRADSTSSRAPVYLNNAIESYRSAGLRNEEKGLRQTMLHRFPELANGYSNAARLMELSFALRDSQALNEAAQTLIRQFPDSAETIAAFLFLGMVNEDQDAFAAALRTQQSRAEAGKPGLPGHGEMAEVFLLSVRTGDVERASGGSLLLPDFRLRSGREAWPGLEASIESLHTASDYPSAASVLALSHLARLEAARAEVIREKAGMKGARPGDARSLGKLEEVLERSFIHDQRALQALQAATVRLRLLRERSQSGDRSPPGREDPYGLHLLSELASWNGETVEPERLLERERRRLRMQMGQVVLRMVEQWARLAQNEPGNDPYRILYRLEVMRDILAPRLGTATRIMLDPDQTVRVDEAALQPLLQTVDQLRVDPLAREVLFGRYGEMGDRFLEQARREGASGAKRAKLHQVADSLSDLQDGVLTLLDEGTLLLAGLADSMAYLPTRPLQIDSLLLLHLEELLQHTGKMDQLARWCTDESAVLAAEGGSAERAILREAAVRLQDLATGWRDGALIALESIVVQIDLEKWREHPAVRELARQLLLHDPAGYATLFDLRQTRHVVLSGNGWNFMVGNRGVQQQVRFEEGNWSDPNPGGETPDLVIATLPSDTLVAECILPVEGLVVAASLEITASCGYEAYLNGSYFAEAINPPDLTGEPEVWELRTLLRRGDNSLRILLSEDRPLGFMARVLYSTVPVPEKGAAIMQVSGYGGGR